MEPARPPSLGHRTIETTTQMIEPAPVPPPVIPADAALTEKIAALIAEVRAGDAAFAKADTDSGRMVAGLRAAEGSEAWIVAQEALSALQSARQQSATALGEIDSLAVARAADAAENPTLGGLAELASAQADAEAVVARQTARIEALTRR